MTTPQDELSSGAPAYWTQARQAILRWLRKEAPSLAELYEGAVELLYGQQLPGWSRFVPHAVAEIRNRLPGYVAHFEGGGRLEYHREVQALLVEWEGAGLPLETIEVSAMPPEVTEVSVSQAVFVRVRSLVSRHATIPVKTRAAAQALFNAAAPENEREATSLMPVQEQWLKVTGWFRERDHDNSQTDAECDLAEYRNQFETAESTLAGLARGFFETLDELDELLEEANG